ncbi:MAG: hypothetical protein KAJ47_04050, partial [Candidatus Aenigmarchaeota archaeon]|nr:hypothetical protein [Candidatus Aenigmarchaeota archaeon]
NIKNMGELIEAVQDEFDLIVIDCPPVIEFPDAPILCSYADAVFYIIEAEKTRIETVKYAHSLLLKEGINSQGVILNKKKKYIPAMLYKFL